MKYIWLFFLSILSVFLLINIISAQTPTIVIGIRNLSQFNNDLNLNNAYNASYVPYMGATGNVNISPYNLTLTNLIFPEGRSITYDDYSNTFTISEDTHISGWLTLSGALFTDSIEFATDDDLLYSDARNEWEFLIGGGEEFSINETTIDAYNNNIITLQNITADYFKGDGSLLTGITGGNLSFNQSFTNILYAPNTTAGIQYLINNTGVYSTYNSTYLSTYNSTYAGYDSTYNASYVPYTGAINNINLGIYNLSTLGYFAGQPLDSSIGSGILNASSLKISCGCINVSDEGGLNVWYPDMKVRIWNYGNIRYCDISSNTVAVPNNAHTVYYVDSNCAIQTKSWDNYFAQNLNPPNYVRIFDVYAVGGDIGVLKGGTIIGLTARKSKWNNINCNKGTHLAVCDGMDITKGIFPEINMSSGHFKYINSISTSQQRNSNPDGIHIVCASDASHTTGTQINMTGCDNGVSLTTCSTNKIRRYIIYSIGWGVHTKIHQLAPLDSETYKNIGDCINVEKYPLSYTFPSNEEGVAIPLAFYCGQRDDSSWKDGLVDIRISGGGFGASPDLSIFIAYDGLTKNWNAGDYNIITNENMTADYFKGDGSLLTGITGGNLSFNQTLTDNLYVPYSGAIKNVDLNAKNLTGFSNLVSVDATASGLKAIALGYGASATGIDSVAFGWATSSGDYSSAMGFDVTASGDGSIAIGNNAFECSQIDAICLGGGNVGIGTGNPSNQLSVSGTTDISGNTLVGGYVNASTLSSFGTSTDYIKFTEFDLGAWGKIPELTPVSTFALGSDFGALKGNWYMKTSGTSNGLYIGKNDFSSYVNLDYDNANSILGFGFSGVDKLKLEPTKLYPNTNHELDLGDSSHNFNELYIEDILIENRLTHQGDTNTYIDFVDDDVIALYSNTHRMLEFYAPAGEQPIITMNDIADDTDFQVNANSIVPALFVEGSSGNVNVTQNFYAHKDSYFKDDVFITDELKVGGEMVIGDATPIANLPLLINQSADGLAFQIRGYDDRNDKTFTGAFNSAGNFLFDGTVIKVIWNTALILGDDIDIGFGAGRYYRMAYDTSSTRFHFWTTKGDGDTTEDIFEVAQDSNNITFDGALLLDEANNYQDFAVCYGSGGKLGHCIDAVNSTGGCTCVVN